MYPQADAAELFPDVREKLKLAVERKAKAIAISHRAPEPTVTFDPGTSAVFNDEGLTARVVTGFQTELGKDNVVPAGSSDGGRGLW